MITEQDGRLARTVLLDEVAKLDIVTVEVDPASTYRIAGVKIAGEGLLGRGEIRGGDTTYAKLHRLREGQVVYRKLTAWEGPITVVPQDFDGFYVSSEFPTITLDTDQILPEYMELICRDPQFHGEMKALCTGTAERRNRLTPEHLLSISISLPALEVQRSVSRHIARLDRLVSATEAMRVAAEELYQAALDQQVDLLDDDPVSLSAVVQRIVSGRSPKCDERRPIDGEWGVLKVSSVRRLQFDGREAKKLPDGEALFPNAEVQPGDLLTIRASGSRRLVGAFCIAEDPPARRLMSDYHWRVELDPARADRRYVAHIMGATAVRDELELAIVGSTTAAKLSKGRLLEVAIPLPASLVDQKRIARQLDALHSVVRTSQEQLVTLRAVHRSALRQLLAEDATPLVAA